MLLASSSSCVRHNACRSQTGLIVITYLGMAIPNVKRFRPFCPVCNENFTLMAVLPKDVDPDAYVKDAVQRHDHKAFQDARQQMFKIRVGQQKQKKAK
jgi:hypothetical protein